MSPKRGERAAPPPIGDEWDLRFANSDSAKGWDHLAQHAPGNLRRAYDRIRETPRVSGSDRQHRLLGVLGTAMFKGHELERWQYEVTGGGRIWYLIDDAEHVIWLIYAGTGHPKATD